VGAFTASIWSGLSLGCGVVVDRSARAPDLPAELWVRLADVNDAGCVVPKIQDEIETEAVAMDGPAIKRASYQTLIDTLLATVVGLLAIEGMLIAGIGAVLGTGLGLLASVLPGRAAARTSPVAALAVD
jgi:hypothetical protein